MLESLCTLSSPRVYLLGALLMGLRVLWKTRPRKCDCCNQITKPYVANVNGEAFDVRFLLVFLFALFWPLAVALMIARRLFMLFDSDSSSDHDDHS